MAANATKQLKPLTNRLSVHDLHQRADRIARRSTTRDIAIEALHRATHVGLGFGELMQRGFFGRLKWVLTGR